MSYPGPGYIREEKDVMYLILFSLHFFPFAVKEEDLFEAVSVDDGFSYFEFRSALVRLLEKQYIISRTEKGEPHYYINGHGGQVLGLMLNELPLSVRDRAEKASLQVVARIKRENTVSADHVKNPDGTYTIHLRIHQGETDHLSLKLLAYTRGQCDVIEETFRKQTKDVFRELLTLLSGKVPME